MQIEGGARPNLMALPACSSVCKWEPLIRGKAFGQAIDNPGRPNLSYLLPLVNGMQIGNPWIDSVQGLCVLSSSRMHARLVVLVPQA